MDERTKRKSKDLSENIPKAVTRDVRDVAVNRTETAITWIGHSSFLIQIQGLNIMTDPVWARRMGFQKRLTEPGYELSELPDIDAVLISHGHYDHLDFPSIKTERKPGFLRACGIEKAVQQKRPQKGP